MNKHFRVLGSTFLKLEELGVPASAVLRRAGLPQGFIDQPRVLLKTEELFTLWSAVGEVSTNPAIGGGCVLRGISYHSGKCRDSADGSLLRHFREHS
jgi:hypothetical protein